MRAVLPVLTAIVGLALVAPSASGGFWGPRDRLAVRSHGERMGGTLHFYDWCAENSEYCGSGHLDYAYDPNPRRLPFHRRSLMRLRTAAGAKRITVTFGRRGSDKRIAAKRVGRRRWTLRAPGAVHRKQEISVVVDYRYRKDGETYGGRYYFSLPVEKHAH